MAKYRDFNTPPKRGLSNGFTLETQGLPSILGLYRTSSMPPLPVAPLLVTPVKSAMIVITSDNMTLMDSAKYFDTSNDNHVCYKFTTVLSMGLIKKAFEYSTKIIEGKYPPDGLRPVCECVIIMGEKLNIQHIEYYISLFPESPWFYYLRGLYNFFEVKNYRRAYDNFILAREKNFPYLNQLYIFLFRCCYYNRAILKYPFILNIMNGSHIMGNIISDPFVSYFIERYNGRDVLKFYQQLTALYHGMSNGALEIFDSLFKWYFNDMEFILYLTQNIIKFPKEEWLNPAPGENIISNAFLVRVMNFVLDEPIEAMNAFIDVRLPVACKIMPSKTEETFYDKYVCILIILGRYEEIKTNPCIPNDLQKIADLISYINRDVLPETKKNISEMIVKIHHAHSARVLIPLDKSEI